MSELNLQKQLIKDCIKGSRAAQYRLYRMYSKAMYNICLRMCKNEWDAEDVLQLSFIDIFRKLESFKFQSTPGAWIKRIVINNCINFIKKKKIHFEDVDQLSIPEEEPELSNKHLNVEAVKEALYRLPEGYRIVVTLYLFEGYDHKEIAEILKVTESTSKSQYSRAKKKLKQILLSDYASRLII